MKRNFDAVMTQLDGKPIKDGNPQLKYMTNSDGDVLIDATGRHVLALKGAAGEPIILKDAPDCTLKTLSLGVLSPRMDGDKDLSGDKVMAMYRLADRISKGGAVEVTIDEVALLKDRIMKGYSNFILIGRAVDALSADYIEPATAAETSAAG